MKAYLGSSVYASMDENGLILTTNDGQQTTNTIALDAHAIQALLEFLKKAGHNEAR